MANETVLVIDDEKDLIELVRYNLEKEGFRVLSALDGEAGISIAAQEFPDAVIVDLMLPGIDGLDVCRRLRAAERTAFIPVIMLTAKASESDRIVGLELGADDYVTKPFSPRELAARVKAVLRRASRPQPELIRRGELLIDPERHEVACGGAAVSLTATEFRLLMLLAARPGRVFSRNEIIDATLGRDVTVLDRTVDVHVVSLRKKLGKCGKWVETVRGFGYRFGDGEDAP
ncbi:MAG TPA: response regulator [Acidobacteriota bacterium]|nr:response regulator [Acidobacteriota bacterium]